MAWAPMSVTRPTLSVTCMTGGPGPRVAALLRVFREVDPRGLLNPGVLIGPFHYDRSAIHLTLLPGRAGLLANTPFGSLSV